MAETKAYLAVGEETTRGTAESGTVGFIPLNNFTLPTPNYSVKKRGEYRGEDTARGETTELRMGEKWDGLSLEMPAFTEAGSTKGIVGTILKHFFGRAASTQNAATGQYRHIMSVVNDPFATANLGTKALTFNMNSMQGSAIKNHPYIGGRVSTLAFKQDVGAPLVITAGCMGQKLGTIAAGIGSPVFPLENLRCDFNNLSIRNGATVTRTGTPPDYTAITSTGAVVKPDSISLELERGMSDRPLLDGTLYPSKTSVGILTGKLTIGIDFEDPASGFNTLTEFTAWLAATSATNYVLTWDTGAQAGTGDNHMLVIDLPICNRLGGMPTITREGDAKVSLSYDLHYDVTTLYAVSCQLKNTAATI